MEFLTAKQFAAEKLAKHRASLLTATAVGTAVMAQGHAFAAEVTQSGQIVVSASEKEGIRNGLFAGITNLVSLLMSFADILLVVGAAYVGFSFIKSLVLKR